MAEEKNTGSGNGFLYFIVGAMVVAVIGIGYVVLSGNVPGGGEEKMKIELKTEGGKE